MYSTEDTIFALSTCYGKSGIAVVRISGPKSLKSVEEFGIKKKLVPRVATLAKIKDFMTGEFIDEVIVIYFPAEASYTGQDLVELHVHGSIAIINKILSHLGNSAYMRLAQNGEFTRLALINGRIATSKAEGLIAVMHAETELQRQVAAKAFNGENDVVFNNLKKSVIKVLACSEAFIDFPEDTNNEIESIDAMILSLIKLFQDIKDKINSANMLMEGVKIILVGDVNVGKSTLMNLITDKDTSIVSDIKGTTRDIVKFKGDVSGVPVIFHDTAGIRASDDDIECQGISKTLNNLKNSQIIVLILDVSKKLNGNIVSQVKSNVLKGSKIILLLNKVDKISSKVRGVKISNIIKGIKIECSSICQTSLLSGEGLDQFKVDLKSAALSFVSPSSNHIVISLRKQEMISSCLDLLYDALNHKVMDLKAAELNCVAGQIGLLLGRIENEEILDELFSSFCIGK